MQKVSKAYKEAMKRPLRNRAYIHISIGVINQDAQKTAYTEIPENSFTGYSSPAKPFNNYEIDSIYGGAELCKNGRQYGISSERYPRSCYEQWSCDGKPAGKH